MSAATPPATRADRRPRLSAAAPAVLVVVAVVGVGGGAALLQSLGLVPLVGEPRLGVTAYRGVSGDLLSATWLSFTLAAASTAVAAGVGLLTAVLLLGSARGRSMLAAMATATLPVPHLVGAASVGLLLADGGLLGRWLGVAAADWPALVAGSWPVAVVVEFAWKESAFVALVVAATLAARTTEYLEAAALLGAGPRQRLRHVTLPLAAPGLLVASAISFAYTFGSYEVAWLLGPAYPEPLPVLAYRLFTSTDLAARPEAMAVAVVTIAGAGAVAAAAVVVLRRTAAWR